MSELRKAAPSPADSVARSMGAKLAEKIAALASELPAEQTAGDKPTK